MRRRMTPSIPPATAGTSNMSRAADRCANSWSSTCCCATRITIGPADTETSVAITRLAAKGILTAAATDLERALALAWPCKA